MSGEKSEFLQLKELPPSWAMLMICACGFIHYKCKGRGRRIKSDGKWVIYFAVITQLFAISFKHSY